MSAYTDAILAESALVGFWKLDETSGTSAVDAKNARNGTHQASPTVGATGILPTDTGGKAVTYARASSQYTSIADNAAFEGQSAWSVEAWIKLATLPGSNEGYGIMAKEGCWQLGIYNDTFTPRALFASGNATDSQAYLTWAPSANTLYHIVMTWSAATGVKVYVNGVLLGSAAQASAMPSNSNGVRIGSLTAANPYYFNGTIDNVAVYNAVLTSTQVSDHYILGTTYTGSIAAGIDVAGAMTGLSPQSPIDASINIAGAMTGAKLERVAVAAATPGDEYRLYNASNTLIASDTVDAGGIAQIFAPSTSLPPAGGGYVEGFTGGISNGKRWPATGSDLLAARERVYIADPDTVTIDELNVSGYDGNPYYCTTQFGGTTSQVIETATKRFVVYRSTTLADGSLARRYTIIRRDKATRAIDQTYVFSAGLGDGHETFAMARAPNGKIRFVRGGSSNAIRMYETTSADDISAWSDLGDAVADSGPSFGQGEFIYKIAHDGGNHILYYTAPGGTLKYAWSTNASPAPMTTVTLVTPSTTGNVRGVLCGDLYLGTTGSTGGALEIGIVWSLYEDAAGYANAYQDIYFMKSTNVFGNATKADGTSVGTLPLVVPSGSGPMTGPDVVLDGLYYSPWARVLKVNGKITILSDGERSDYDDWAKLCSWNGSSWDVRDIPGILSNDTGFATGAPYSSGAPKFGNWGFAMQTDAANPNRVHVYYTDRNADTADVGMRLVRATTDDFGVTWTELVIAQDNFEPWSYAWMDDGNPSEQTVGGYGLAYPKVPDGYPGTVVFSTPSEPFATAFEATFPPNIATIAAGVAVASEMAGAELLDQIVAVGQAVETNEAFSAVPGQSIQAIAVGQATETDTAQPITAPGAAQIIAVGQALESDTAWAATATSGAWLIAVGQAFETDSAFSISSPGTAPSIKHPTFVRVVGPAGTVPNGPGTRVVVASP